MDRHFVEEAKWRQFQTQGGERKAQLKAGNDIRPVTILRENGHNSIKLPRHGKQNRSQIEKMVADPSYSLTINMGYHPNRVPIALFHSAHLMLFRLFGYEYAFSFGGQAVRSWLRKGSLPFGVSAACQDLPAKITGALTVGLVGIAFVNGVRCLMVCTPFCDNEKRRVVMLPAFKQSDLNAYMAAFDGRAKTIALHVRQVGEHPPVEALADEQYRWFGHFLLEMACDQ